MSDSEDFKSYKNMDDWMRNRQFCDSDEVYTNGAELITVNDVLKGWNYYMNLTEERARAELLADLEQRLRFWDNKANAIPEYVWCVINAMKERKNGKKE